MKDLVLVTQRGAIIICYEMLGYPHLLRPYLDLILLLSLYRDEEIAIIFAALGPILPPDHVL